MSEIKLFRICITTKKNIFEVDSIDIFQNESIIVSIDIFLNESIILALRSRFLFINDISLILRENF